MLACQNKSVFAFVAHADVAEVRRDAAIAACYVITYDNVTA